MLESLNLLILFNQTSINNRSKIVETNSYCHILSHFYWDEVLQEESADRGKATARTAFPLFIAKTSRRRLY